MRNSSDLVGIGEAVRGAGRTILLVDDDTDPASDEGDEGVLVGEVVAEVDREAPVPAESDLVEQPPERPALVPVDVGPELEDALPAGLAQARRRTARTASTAASTSGTRRASTAR